MLRSVRQVRSFPSLRQATAFQASSGQPQRSLASTVLLTSWTQARVPDLKEELKKRGLSTCVVSGCRLIVGPQLLIEPIPSTLSRL